MGRIACISQYSEAENRFGADFVSLAGQEFETLRGLGFTFVARGNEILFDRKNKAITRATVMLGYRNFVELRNNGIVLESPKQLGVFGASYLLPVFLKIEENQNCRAKSAPRVLFTPELEFA